LFVEYSITELLIMLVIWHPLKLEDTQFGSARLLDTIRCEYFRILFQMWLAHTHWKVINETVRFTVPYYSTVLLGKIRSHPQHTTLEDIFGVYHSTADWLGYNL
jgi:hypothetical protein